MRYTRYEDALRQARANSRRGRDWIVFIDASGTPNAEPKRGNVPPGAVVVSDGFVVESATNSGVFPHDQLAVRRANEAAAERHRMRCEAERLAGDVDGIYALLQRVRAAESTGQGSPHPDNPPQLSTI